MGDKKYNLYRITAKSSKHGSHDADITAQILSGTLMEAVTKFHTVFGTAWKILTVTMAIENVSEDSL